MGDRKLLWILLGLSLLIMVSARSMIEDDIEEVVEEDYDYYRCDPTCERNCHMLKCGAGTVRDSCGCCTCAQMEGEYCNFRPRDKRRGRRDVVNLKKSRLLSSFFSLTPPYTFAPTTSFTNPAFVEDVNTASSPTIADFYASTVGVVDSFAIKNQDRKKNEQKPSPNLPTKVKHTGGIYSRHLNHYLGRKKNSFGDKTVYGTCGDYLECKPLFALPDGGEENKNDESFRVVENPKLKPFYQEAKKTTAKGKTAQLIEQWKKKKGFNFGANWDRDGGGSKFNKNKNELQQSNNYGNSDDNKNSLRQEVDEYFFSLFSSSSPFLPSSFPTNKIDNFPRSPVVGICVCRYAVTVCASNGQTYKNICHLRSESGLGEGSNPDVHVIKEGPCDPPVAGE